MKWQYHFQRAALGPWAHSCHIDGGSAPRTAAVRRRRGEAVGGRRSAPRRAHLTQNFRPLSALSTGSSRLIFHELGPVLIQVAGLANSLTLTASVFFQVGLLHEGSRTVTVFRLSLSLVFAVTRARPPNSLGPALPRPVVASEQHATDWRCEARIQ